MLKPKCIFLALLTACLSLASRSSFAAESANASAVLTPFVNDDTFVAAYVDASQIKPSENVNALTKLLHIPPSNNPQFPLGLMMVDGMLHRFREAGGRGLYLVAGLADIHIGGGPIAVATTQAGQSSDKLEQLFRDLIRELSPMIFGNKNNSDWQLDVQRRGDAVLVGTKSTVARYATLTSSQRENLLNPLAKLVSDGAITAAVFCPGSEYRRVTRELWPQMPGVLSPLRAELVDEWQYIAAAINSPPDAQPRLTLQAKDNASAEVFAKLWRDLPVAVTQFGGNDQSRQFATEAARLFVDSMPLEVQGARATIRIPTDDRQLGKLSEMFADATDKSQQVYLRKNRMVQFKNLAIAMQTYESEHRHLPTNICDKHGRPLLSWRVAILPHIDQKALYDEFHLDESWDSPHNKPLVAKIPEVFVDGDWKLSQSAKDGKTTYQLPAGPQTIFFDNSGTKVSQITDGLQRTIMILEVEPSRAIEWTRPVDWEVDLDNPKAGLVRDRGVVTTAFADGHVELLNLDKTSDKQLAAMLTRAGGDNLQK